MIPLSTRLLAVPVILALGGCVTTGNGPTPTGTPAPGQPGPSQPSPSQPGPNQPDPSQPDPNQPSPPGQGTNAAGTVNSAVIVFPGNTGGTVGGRGLTQTEFELNEDGTARYRLGEIPDLNGNPVQAISDGILLTYDASKSVDRDHEVSDFFGASWTFVGSPPEAAPGGGGVEHAYIYRAIGDVRPEHVAIARTVRESLHSQALQHPDLAARYVGYHALGDVTQDMPTNATLTYDGKFVGNRRTTITENQHSGGFNGDLSLTATLSGGAGSVEGTMNAVTGFMGDRMQIDFSGPVQGAAFDARDITITPNRPDRVTVNTISDSSGVLGNFYGPDASEVGGVFLLEGDWSGHQTAGGAYYFAGSFFGTQPDE